MAIKNVVTRGYGPSASIAFVVTRGYTIFVPAVVSTNQVKRVTFQSASALVLFLSRQQEITFSSAAQSVAIVAGPSVLSRLLKEDGFIIRKEDGTALLKEQE